MVTIHNTGNYRIDSYGNGTSYVFCHKGALLEVCFEGDDALRFEHEIAAGEAQGWNYDRIFARLWGDYGLVASPCTTIRD